MSGSPEPVTTPNPQPADESEPVPTTVTVIDTLGRYLADEQLSEKAPPGLDRALDSLSSSNAISRAFQHAGFWTWYTYFLATDHIKESVSQLSPEALQHVVAEVSKVQPHASVANRVNHIFLLSDRAPKRCRLLSSNGINLPAPPESVSPDPNPRPPKRTRLEGMRRSPSLELDETELLESQFESTDVIMQSLERDPPEALPRGGTSQQETGLRRLSNDAREASTLLNLNRPSEHKSPRSKYLPRVFPHYMCTTIAKRVDQASVVASFQPHKGVCQLVLDINATEVQHVAKELFGIHIRDRNGRRCAALEHGPTMDIDGSMTLKGALDMAWETLFGQLVTTAIQQSMQRKKELSAGVVLSECVSMEIWTAVDNSSQLTLTVDAESLALVVRQLWKA
ncbi:hypothetical protein EDB80DRAFT_870402 [Ilyonectria destructans]|nr:hypothetical protein EDB80DRAFT_870402 [Ilyonectria destructans]